MGKPLVVKLPGLTTRRHKQSRVQQSAGAARVRKHRQKVKENAVLEAAAKARKLDENRRYRAKLKERRIIDEELDEKMKCNQRG